MILIAFVTFFGCYLRNRSRPFSFEGGEVFPIFGLPPGRRSQSPTPHPLNLISMTSLIWFFQEKLLLGNEKNRKKRFLVLPTFWEGEIQRRRRRRKKVTLAKKKNYVTFSMMSFLFQSFSGKKVTLARAFRALILPPHLGKSIRETLPPPPPS